MTKLSLFVFLLSISTLACGQDSSKKAVLDEMDRQLNCWNNGDIDCFMKGYWKSDSLMFIGKSGVNYGWQATYDRYMKSYPDRQAMGKLEFEIKEVKTIDEITIFMVGRWHLIREIGDLEGHFTLLWKKIEGKWVIATDHTS